MRTLLACVLLAGCAATAPPPKPEAPPFAAAAAIAIGSSKADVRAALGDATVVDFASGYEVWVYRERAAELVMLFDPSGELTKMRVR